ncbi:MAG: HlyC/CorC family transporter [Clostridia bacterium]|nr:HlyC/CorC family transporter [Clostridia bacterium]
MSDFVLYIEIAVLLAFSAFFSASEMAFASVGTLRLKTLDETKSTLCTRTALKIKSKFDDSLAAILVGNGLVNNFSAAIAAVIIISLLGQGYAFVSTLIMTVLVLTFGEIIPKSLAKRFSEKFCMISAVPVYVITLILKPFLFVVIKFIELVSKLWQDKADDTEAVSEDDLENIIDIVGDEGVLDEDEVDLLQNALDFDEVLAYQIITPRVDMEALDIRDPYDVNVKKILETTYSRLPVYEDTPDNIIGVLYINHALKAMADNSTISIRKIMLEPVFVHKTMPIPDVLEKMKECKCHLAVVLDEYGGTLGIITMEDILEQLVGEIFDETDDIEPEFVCIDDTHYEALGDMRIYDFFDEFDIDIEQNEDFDGDITTLGGFVTTMLEGEVEKGNTFYYLGLRFTVTDVEDFRVLKVAVEVLPQAETEDDK